MASPKRYQINTPEVTAEQQGSEVLAINLTTGAYFVLEDSAAYIWDWLTSGVAVDDIISALHAQGVSDAEAMIADYVEQLEQQRLIVSTGEAPTEETPASNTPQVEAAMPFSRPILKIQDDAQQFVTAAPINASSRIIPASKDFASEAYPDEVVMLDLSRGIYYSLPNEAGIIWRGIEQEVTVRDIVATLREHYEGEWITIEDAVITFLNDLHEEGVVRNAGDANSPAQPFPLDDALDEVPPQQKRPFRKPEFTRYDDMQNLLLLDPIHEVDEQIGWPQEAPASEDTP